VAFVCFAISKAKFLPRLQPDKATRWDYDYVEVGETHLPADASGYGYGYALTNLYDDFHPGQSDSDEWTIGSSSSFSSASRNRSPSTGGRSSGEQSFWEGETLGSLSDHEQSR
jgi:inositol phosphorylceramide synthase catalytic subunit